MKGRTLPKHPHPLDPGSGFQIPLLPQHQVQQRPEELAVVAGVGGVLDKEAADVAQIGVGLQQLALEEMVFDESAQLRLQPLVDRRGEAHLLAVNVFVR